MRLYTFLIKNVFALKTFFYDLIFPRDCVSCQTEGAWICNECLSLIKLNGELFCIKCDTVMPRGEICGHCRQNNYLNGVWVAGHYSDKSLSSLIKIFKYKFAEEISEELGFILTKFLEYLIKEDKIKPINDYLLIPVPLYKSRQSWRGFNQAERLATKLAEKNFNVIKNFTDLKRIKYSGPQTKLKKKERIKNVQNSFVWYGAKLSGKKIILVDDVVTTGSTLYECAKELKKHGAEEVWGLVLAKG
jgi:competence protein ComFC